jgi:hypothetical protein
VVVIGFLSLVIGLGARSIVTGDGRYGWGMFKHQVEYDIDYQWVLRDGGTVSYRPGREASKDVLCDRGGEGVG